MIAMVENSRAFCAGESDTFVLVSTENRTFPKETVLRMFDKNGHPWRVWCQPSKLPPEDRNWFAMRIGLGSEKVHKAKLFV